MISEALSNYKKVRISPQRSSGCFQSTLVRKAKQLNIKSAKKSGLPDKLSSEETFVRQARNVRRQYERNRYLLSTSDDNAIFVDTVLQALSPKTQGISSFYDVIPIVCQVIRRTLLYKCP